jgi:chromosome partitioning protein
MHTIAVLNQKGGVGKSTLATNLAAAAHLRKKRVLVVDLDSQGSALDWYSARSEGSELDGLAVVKADKVLSLTRFREIAGTYDIVVLDGPPKLGDMTRSAAVAADVVLIPVQPGPFDLWSAGETQKLLDSADETRADLRRGKVRRLYVLNRAHRHANVSRNAVAAVEEAGRLASTVIHQRVVFAEAAAVGESVLTVQPGGPAAEEIRRLYREVSP